MKRYAFLVLIFFNSISAFGQSLLGLAAGPNYSVIPYSDTYDHAEVNSKFAYSFRSDFSASVTQHLYYSIDISYDHLQAHIIGSESYSSHLRIEDIDLTLGYIGLSLMPEYSFGKKRIFYIRAGGYFSLLVNSKKVGTYGSRVVNGYRPSGKINDNARSDYEDIDFGLSVNTGIRLKISNNAYFVPRVGFNLGLYKYNLLGSNIKDVHRAGFKSAFLLLGIETRLTHSK